MKDPNDCRIEPDDDPALEAVLSRVRAIEPPLAARIKNRLAVTEVLESLAYVSRRGSFAVVASLDIGPPAGRRLLRAGLCVGRGVEISRRRWTVAGATGRA